MIITLCGSARFENLYKKYNEILTFDGHTVFTLTVYPSDKNGNKNWYTEAQKTALDTAHFRKIDASDAIFVIDWMGNDGRPYIGESTRREIEYAQKQNKQVFYLSKTCALRGCLDRLHKRPPCELCDE